MFEQRPEGNDSEPLGTASGKAFQTKRRTERAKNLKKEQGAFKEGQPLEAAVNE